VQIFEKKNTFFFNYSPNKESLVFEKRQSTASLKLSFIDIVAFKAFNPAPWG